VQHGVVQNYYCQQCMLPICCECEMFGEHKGHQIEHLKNVYNKKCEKIKEQLSFIKKHMKAKEMLIKDIQQKNVELKKERDRRLCEIQENTQFYRLKVLNEVCTEEKFLRECAQMIG
jgi:predicted KAP-like P-loop ATPase